VLFFIDGSFFILESKCIWSIMMRGQITFEFIISIVVVLLLFVSGLAIFESSQRTNYSSFDKWTAENIGYRISRNVNNAVLLDENSVIVENLQYSGGDVLISVADNFLIFSGSNLFLQIPMITNKVVFNVTDLNGLIYFKKINGFVVVDYS